MSRKKKKEVEEILKVGKIYKLVKVWVKKGCKSGVPVGVKNLKLAEIPSVGRPLSGKYDSEHFASGDPKEVKFVASTLIVGVRDLPLIGLRIETTTSVYMLLY